MVSKLILSIIVYFIVFSPITLLYKMFYWTISILFLVSSIFIAVLIVKEIRKRFIDLLKVIQLATIYASFIFNGSLFIVKLTKPWLFQRVVSTILSVLTVTTFFYYSLNQVSWVVLANHLKIYRSMINGKSYSEWNSLS